MPVPCSVNKDFFKKWTPDMAYVLGFFAADGYMTLNDRGAHFWNIQITDKDILERVRETIQSEHKIGIRNGKGNEKTIYRLQIGSKEMCNDLRKLGFVPNKTKSLAVPHVPKKYFAHFIRGYFDGDGNVWVGHLHKERKTKSLAIRTVFTSCSHEFLLSIRERLEVCGVCSGVLSKGSGDYYRLTYSINNSLKLGDFMYNQVTPDTGHIFLERKRRKFEEFIKMRL